MRLATNLQQLIVKESRSMGIDGIPAGSGSDQIVNALNLLEQARILARPSDAALAKNTISRSELASIAEELSKVKGEKYDLKSLKADPKQRAIIGGIAGGSLPLMGLLAGINPIQLIAAGLLTGGIGAGYGYGSGVSRNRKLLGTANVLKDYGLLRPDQLRRALPLLAQ